LNKYSDFSKEEIDVIAEAVIQNSQIFTIRNDEDVKSFIERIILSNIQKETGLYGKEIFYDEFKR
jgi:hypothetical protein